MLKSVPLKVQLVGHTVFTPPIKEEGDGNVDLVFWPDESNELDVGLGRLREFDGQALVEFAGTQLTMHAPNIFSGGGPYEQWKDHGTLT